VEGLTVAARAVLDFLGAPDAQPRA